MGWTNKSTPAWQKHYLEYLKSYATHLQVLDSTLDHGYTYDFESESMLVKGCKAGELIHINDLPPQESEREH